MPSRLRPTASVATDAILVGDPGRALLLAQALLEKPRMSNHARGLWGYSGRTPAGAELTIQSTGMGGPSAAIVLGDLAKLGVVRAVRIGTCKAFGDDASLGELLLVTEAHAVGGSAASFGVAAGGTAEPDPALLDRLRIELGDEARAMPVASFDTMRAVAGEAPAGVGAADMQTVAVLARARELGIAVAAILVVTEIDAGEKLADEVLEPAAIGAGKAAASVLSNLQVEG